MRSEFTLPTSIRRGGLEENKRLDRLTYLLMVLPALLLMAAVAAIPFAYMLYISLTRYNLVVPGSETFDGLTNYHRDEHGRPIPLDQHSQVVGYEFCGRVVAAGAKVSKVRPGDRVFKGRLRIRCVLLAGAGPRSLLFTQYLRNVRRLDREIFVADMTELGQIQGAFTEDARQEDYIKGALLPSEAN